MGDKDPINAKKKQMIPQQSYLSEDLIIEEILTRLPVKSVLRFKSVSKQWYSTLSSSDFANAHLIKSRSAPVNTLFIKAFKNHYLFSYDDDDQISGNFEDNLVKIDFDLEDNLAKLDVNFDVEKDFLQLIGCCNGLVCLKILSQKYFLVWNPATRKLNKYMSDGFFFLSGYRFSDPKSGFEAHGFGYASSVDDYKYVRILVECYRNETFSFFHIFCLRENKWRKLEFGYDNVILSPGRAVLINEKLYWIARNAGDGNIIVSFDLGVERFDLIKADLDNMDLLGFMGGSLSKCNYDTVMGDKLLHILEPPATVKSIGLPEGLRLFGGSEMIGFTRTGKFFVTGECNDEPGDAVQHRTLGIVDTRTKPVQYTMLLRLDKFLWIARYVPSLVSPFVNGMPSEA